MEDKNENLVGCDQELKKDFGGLPLFLGVKIIGAEPMDEFTFKQSKGMTPSTECENQEGYRVVYEDGYVSWSPKSVFNKAYRRIDNLTFGLAIESLKQGKKVARSGWNGKNMFLFYVLGDISPREQHNPSIQGFVPKGILVEELPYIAMFTANKKVIPWLASQADILAEDWVLVE